MRISFVAACCLCISFAGAKQAQAAPCSTPLYRQFDFFVGDWSVTNQAGKVIGHDVVTKSFGGCVLIENWHDAGDPSHGMGLTGYDMGRKAWHQDFMDDTGFVLAIDGGLRGTTMTMTGKDYASPGVARLHRVYWTTRTDRSVEELWQTSVDGGRTWKTYFDGIFRHRTST